MKDTLGFNRIVEVICVHQSLETVCVRHPMTLSTLGHFIFMLELISNHLKKVVGHFMLDLL